MVKKVCKLNKSTSDREVPLTITDYFLANNCSPTEFQFSCPLNAPKTQVESGQYKCRSKIIEGKSMPLLSNSNSYYLSEIWMRWILNWPVTELWCSISLGHSFHP